MSQTTQLSSKLVLHVTADVTCHAASWRYMRQLTIHDRHETWSREAAEPQPPPWPTMARHHSQPDTRPANY